MPELDSALIAFLSNAGTAGVVVILILSEWLVPRWAYKRALADAARKDAEIAKLQEALALERQRSNDATQAGAVTNQLISGLVKLASGYHDEHPRIEGADSKILPGTRAALDLTGEDLGL